MKGDQKYFPIYDKDGKLLPHFYFRIEHQPRRSNRDHRRERKSGSPTFDRCGILLQNRLKQNWLIGLPRLETVLFQQQLGTLKTN